MAVECEPLATRDVRAAAGLLARAFAGDGIISRYLDGPLRRRLAAPAMFRSVVHAHVPYGTVHGARVGSRLVGVAVWAPPEPPPLPERARIRSLLSLLEARALFPVRTGPLFVGLSELAALHPAEPHWSLVFAGVEPGLQGGGIGRALLAPGLEEADRAGVAAYLETPFPQTHPFYERLGFAITATATPFPDARPMTIMVRPAR